jgi:predicted metalloprotease
MRWEGRRESENVRTGGGGRMVVGGGAGLLIVYVLAALLGVDPTGLFSSGGSSGPTTAEEERLTHFVKVVLADTEDVWHAIFRQSGREYREPQMVLFRGQVASACGRASSAVGPFYCPGDQTVYLDLSFLGELGSRFQAPGDFAQAYVIAHEVGHHVQNLLGTFDRAQKMEKAAGEVERNRISVRVELQADFLAGVWAHHAQKTKQILDPGDLEEALRAASAVGDDRLQQQARGRVVPDSFTHGTSAQRAAWFRLGFETGDLSRGDTFDDRLFASVGTR